MPDDLSGTILPIGTLVVPTGLPGGGGAQIGIGMSLPAPSTAQAGNLFWRESDAKLFLFNGNEWVIVVNTPGGGSDKRIITVGTSQPSNAEIGEFWYNPTTGHLLLWNGTAWVSTVYRIPGVVDGSEAQPGEVGEVIEAAGTPFWMTSGTSQRMATLNVPPGSWSIWAAGRFVSDPTNTAQYCSMVINLDQSPSNSLRGTRGVTAAGGVLQGSYGLESHGGMLNVTTTTPVYLMGYSVSGGGGYVTATGWLYARRTY